MDQVVRWAFLEILKSMIAADKKLKEFKKKPKFQMVIPRNAKH